MTDRILHTIEAVAWLSMAVLASLFVLNAPALAQTAAMRAEAMQLVTLCKPDYQRLCATVAPGGGRILACLKLHADNLSGGCAAALDRAEKLKSEAQAAGVMPK